MKQVWKYILNGLRGYLSVSFAVALIIAFALWGAIKLGHTYTTEVHFDTIINEQSAPTIATVEGTGYQILKFEYATRNGIAIERKEIHLRRIKTDSVLIEPRSLQKALTGKYGNTIKIVSVENNPRLQ